MIRSVLDHPLVSQRYFFPADDAPKSPWPVDVGAAWLSCALERPHATGRTVLFFHGNGELVSDYEPWLARAFAKEGLNTVLVEYRGYGGSTGEPCLVGMLDDGEAVLDALELDPAQTVVFGRSVGSIYALELAARRPSICGLVLESGIADVLERVLLRVAPEELGVRHDELAAEVATHFDHRKKLAQYGGPLLVLHAEHDSLVDRSHAERLARWGRSNRSRMVLFDEGDHNSVMRSNWSQYWEEVRRFAGSLGDA